VGAHHLAKYVIYNGDQVILDDPNVTSVATTSPCGAHNCSALQLVAEVGNLAVGQYYGFVVKSVYSYVQGGDTVEGEPSGTVQMLVTDPPSPPRDIAATALVGGMKLSWKPPANTGMGNIWSVFYSNSSGVLRGYKLLVSTLSTYDPAGCAGGQSQSCYSRVLPSWAAEASINGLQGGVAYNAWLLAYNVLFEGDSASLMSFTVRQVATAPQNAILSLEDHLVLQLRWQQPNSTGAETGIATDYYSVEWTRDSATFSSCRAESSLQCYSTKDIALPGGCRACAVHTCKAGEVCFSSEVESEEGPRYTVLGCTSSENQVGGYLGEGVCGDPFSSIYYNCHFCSTSRCNSPLASQGSSHFCPQADAEPYCLQEVSTGSVVIAAAGPGEAFETRVVADEACNASTQVYHHNLPPSVFNLSVGITAFSFGDLQFSLDDGATYHFRVAACWNDLGCGEFSQPLSASAVRLSMPAMVKPLSDRAGVRTDVNIKLTPIKGLKQMGMILLQFPEEFTVDEQSGLGNLASLCSLATHIPAPLCTGSLCTSTCVSRCVVSVGNSSSRYERCLLNCSTANLTASAADVALENDTASNVLMDLCHPAWGGVNCSEISFCPGNMSDVGHNCSGVPAVSKVMCTVNGTVLSTFTIAVRGNDVTIQLPDNFRAAPGQELTFQLQAIVNPQRSGQTPRVRISTFTAQGIMIDENSQVLGHMLSPGSLAVSVAVYVPIAGQLSDASISVASPGGYPLGTDLILMTQGNFSFNGAAVACLMLHATSWCDRAVVAATGKDMIRIRIIEAIQTESIIIPLTGVLVGAVPGDTGLWQAYTELQNAQMGKNESVSGVNIQTGILDLGLGMDWESLTFGSMLDLAMQYMHSRDLSMMPGVAVLSVEFPSGLDLSASEAEIKGSDGSGVEQSYSYVSYNISGNSSSGHLLEVTFGENRTDVGMSEPLSWVVRLSGVGVPHFRLDVAAIKAKTMSRTLDVNNVVLAEKVANTTTLYRQYSPGIMRDVAVDVSSSEAGALTNLAVNFTTSNPMPKQAILRVVSSAYVKFCLGGCRVFFNMSGGGVRNVSYTLNSSDTMLFIAVDLEQEMAAGSPFKLRVEGLRSLPWQGNVSLKLSVVDRLTMRVIEEALDIAPLAIRRAEIPAVVCELAEPSPDRLGRWDTRRPVLANQVHMGVRFVSPVDVPCASYMLVRVQGANITQVGLDPVYAHMQGSADYVANVTQDGGILLTQARPSLAHEVYCLDASIAVAFNFIVSVSVATGSLRGVARGYQIQVFQTLTPEPSIAASFSGLFRDTLIPLPSMVPPAQATGNRRLLENGALLSSPGTLNMETKISLSSDLAGDVSDVTLSLRLLTDVSAFGSFIVNLPTDALLLPDSSVEKVGMDGSLLVNMSRSSNSLILSRDPSDSTALEYGRTQTTCTTTGGTAQEGTACVFPFVYFGSTVYSCTTEDNANVPWCSTTQRFNGQWGNCKCVDNQIDLNITITVRKLKLPTYSGRMIFQLLAVESTNTTDYLVAQDIGIATSLRPNSIGNVSLTLDPTQAGALANMTLKVILFNPLPADGMLQVVFPEHFSLDMPAQGMTMTGEMIGVTFASQVMTLSRSLAMAGLESPAGSEFIISVPMSVRVRPWSGDVVFKVRTLMGPFLNYVVADQAQDTVRVFPNDLKDVAVDLTSSVAGSRGAASVRFRPTNAIPLHGGILVTLPVNFELDDPSLEKSWKLCGVVGAANITLENIRIDKDDGSGRWQVLMMLSDDQMLSKDSLVEFMIPGVVIRQYSGLSGPFAIRTVTFAGAVIDHSLAGTEMKIMPDMLSAASVSVLSAEAGAVSSVQVSFTISNPLPANGQISVAFPNNFELLSPVSNGYLVGIAGMLAVSSYLPEESGRCPVGAMAHFGCNVTLQVEAEETPIGSSISFGITNVGMMHLAGVTGTYVVQTRTMEGAIIDQVTVTQSSVGPSKLGFATVAPQGIMRASTNATLQVSFTTANPVRTGDFVHVIFSPLFNLTDTCYSLGGCGQVTVSGTGVNLLRTEHDRAIISVTQDYPAESDVQVIIAGVKAPAVGGFTGTYQIKTVSASGVDIDIDLDVEQLTTSPGKMQAQLVLESTAAGDVTSVLVHIDVTSAIPAADALFELVLPRGASASSSAAATTVSGLDGSLHLALSGNVLILERRDASQEVPAGGTVSFSLSGIVNPPRAGSFDCIVRSKRSILSRTVSGLSSDMGTLTRVLDEVEVSVSIDPAPLEDAGVYPSPLSVGYRGPVRVRFRVANALPADGSIQLNFSSGLADLSSVLTSSFMSATMQEALVTFVDGTTCTSSEGSVVNIKRTSGLAVEAGVFVDVEASIVQIFGFVNSRGYIQVSTKTSDGVLIDSQEVPVHVSDSGVLTQAEGVMSPCAAQVTCSGSCCSASDAQQHSTAGTISDGPGPYQVNSNCIWIIAAECGNLDFKFTSFDVEKDIDMVKIYECASKDCSLSNSTEIDHLSYSHNSSNVMPEYRPASGFLKVVFTSDGAVQGEGFEASWSSTYTDLRAIGSPGTAAGTEARLHVSFWSASVLPVDGMISIELPSGGHANEDRAACFVNATGSISDAAVLVVKGTAFEKGDTLNMTVGGGIPSGQVVEVVCSNVRARIWAGIAEYKVRSAGAGGDVIDAGVLTTIVSPGSLQEMKLNQSERMAGFRNDLEISFRTRNMLPKGAVVEVQIPPYFTVALADLEAVGSVNGEHQRFKTTYKEPQGGSINTEGGSVLVHLKDLQLAANALIKFNLLGIVNRNFAGEVIVMVRTRHLPKKYFDLRTDRDFAIVDEASGRVSINPVAINNVSVVPSESVAGIWRTLELSYTLSSPLPADGTISITFPPYYDVSRVSSTSSFLPGVDGVVNVEVRGRNVSLSRFEGTEVASGTPIRVQVVNVQLPPFEDERGYQPLICDTEQDVCFFMQTLTLGIRDPMSSAIETAFFPPVVTKRSALSIPGAPYSGSYRRLLPAGPGLVNVLPAQSRAGDLTDLTFEFWTVNMVPVGGHIVVELASGFAVETYTTPQCSASNNVQVTTVTVVDSNRLQMTIGAAMKESLSVTLVCAGIKVQETSGLQVQHHVYTSTADVPLKVIDSGFGYTDVVSGSVMAGAVDLSTLIAGSPVMLQVSASLTNRVPVSGTVEMDLPASFSPIISASDFRAAAAANSSDLTSQIRFEYGYNLICRGNVSAYRRGYAYDLSSHPQGLYTLRIESVDCTLPAGVALNFNVSGLRNRGWEGPTGTFLLRTRTPAEVLIDGCDPTDTQHSVHCQSEMLAESILVPSSPTPAEVLLEVYTSGNEGRAILSFTTSTTLYHDSIIEATFPDGFALDRYAPLSGLHTGIDGVLDFQVQGQTRITLTRRLGSDIVPGSMVRIELAAVQNRKASDCSDVGTCGTSSGDVQVRLATRDGVTTDLVNIALEKLDVAFLEDTDIEPSALVAGALGHAVVTFRLVNPLPADGKVYLDFPPGVALVEPLIVQAISGIDGLFAVSTSGQRRVIVDRLRGSLVHTGVEVRFNLTGVRNRVYSGPSGTYQIRTALNDGTLIDADLDVPSDILQPGEIQNVRIVPDSLVAGVTSKLLVSFAVANPVLPDFGIELQLPSGFRFPTHWTIADGVLNVASATRAVLVNHIAYPLAAGEGDFMLEFQDDRTVVLWRNGTDKTILPCNFSRPEFELRREVISPGCTGLDELYRDCTISFAFENITNRHISGQSSMYRLRTLLPDRTIVDESLVNGHEVKHGLLLGTSIDPASHVAGKRTTALVSMLASNGLPSDGKVEVVFPEGFDVRGLSLGKSASNMLVAQGGALIADQVPRFLNLHATTNSRVIVDTSSISLSFEMNFEPELETKIIVGNLGTSITETGNLEWGGPDLDKFGPHAEWVRLNGEITITVKANIPAGHRVNLWFDLHNPNSTNATGVHPTIKTLVPSCGSECASMPTALAEFSGEEVLRVNDTARSVTQSIASANHVAGELVTMTMELQFNFALRPGHRVLVAGLTGTDTVSMVNLSVTGSAAAFFRNRGLWRQSQGSLELSVWEKIPARMMIELLFVLRNSGTLRASGVTPVLTVEGDDVTFVELSQDNMTWSGVLMPIESPKFSVKSIGQNTLAFNALNKVSITLRPTAILTSGTTITISGLNSQTVGSLVVRGENAPVFNPVASWSKASGTLTLTVAPGGGPESATPGMRDDRDTVIYVMLRNPETMSPGSVPSIRTNGIPIATMDGVTLRAQADGNFTEATISYSSTKAFLRNQVYLSLTPNANLPSGSRITVTKLPLDTESNAICLNTTVHDTPCMFPFEWAGQTWTKCVTSPAVSGGVTTPLNQGLPWCPTQDSFIEKLANQSRDQGQQNITYINQQLGSMWSYCRCDSHANKMLWGKDADLFNQIGSWDATKSTLTLILAPGKEIAAGQAVDVSFQIRNPGVQIESGIPEYMWARVAAKIVDPYIEAECSSVEILPNRSLDWGLSRYVAERVGNDVAGILIINVTEIPNIADPAQQRLKLNFCSFEVGSYGNIYGIAPMVEVADGDMFTIARQPIDAEELIIKPHVCSLLQDAGAATASSVTRINSDPTWVVSSLGIGSNHYGALSSITVTLQPNWELEYPTQIAICCVNGFKVPNPEDGEKIAVFDQDGLLFENAGTFVESTGVVTLAVGEGMIVPCNKTSILSFRLRNFRDRTSLDLPGNLTASGPLGFFNSPLATPAAPAVAVPAGFYWAYKDAADTSAAYGTMNRITVTIQPSQELFYPTRITIGNLLGSTTPTNQNNGLSLKGTGAFRFSKGEWVNDLNSCGSLNQLDCVDASARLVLHILEWVPSSAPTVVSFDLRNKPFFVQGRTPSISVSGFVCNTTNSTNLDRPECAIDGSSQSMHGQPILEASSPAGFTRLTVSPSTRVVGAISTITVSMRPNWYMEANTTLTLTGMSDTCPDTAAYFEPPAYCINQQNPTSASLSLMGASQAIFGGSGSWDHLTGHLVLQVQQAITAGSEIEVKFKLRNKGIFFKGVTLGLKIPVLGSELLDGVLMEREARRVTVRRTGQGRAIQPGESLTFTLQHIRVTEHAGPSGTYQLSTMLGDGTLLDQDLSVRQTVIQPSQLQARLTMSPRIAGARGDVLVEMSTSNPVPAGGSVHVWFPAGFQLDTGHWDVVINDEYIKGGRAGLQVDSNSGNFTVMVGTAGTHFMESGLGDVYNWHTSAIVTNVGPGLPAWQRWNFTLKGVQFPIASVVRAVGAGGGNGTYQVRTFTQENAVIDEDHDVPGGAYFEPGTLMHAEVRPSSLVAGDISDLTISFVTFNPMSADARIELTLPEGFAFAGDPDHKSLEGYEAVGPWRAHYGLDYTIVQHPGISLPVGATRARHMQVEVLDDSIQGNLTMTVHDTRRCTFWRRSGSTVARHTRVGLRVFDPTTDFAVLAPTIGVRNPTVSGLTGNFELRVRLHDNTLVDQDLSVPALVLSPGTLSNVHIGPVDSTAGAVSDLRISFAVRNPLPVNSTISVTLPFEDVSVANHLLSSGQAMDALDGSVSLTVETAQSTGVETLVLQRLGATTTVSPCVKPVCGSENIVSQKVHTAFQSSWRRPPSYAAFAFAADGNSWVSGPSLPHFVEYDIGKAVSVCSYAFQSRPTDVLGYLRADGPTSYQLLGSLDGTSFTTLHEVTDGQEWSSGEEERAHALHTNAHFRYFRLKVTDVPGRLTGNKYTVIRNLRLTAPTGADPHSSAQEAQCIVTMVLPKLVRNRRFAGVTNPYKVVTYDWAGRVLDHHLRGQGTQIVPAQLQDGSVVPSSTLAGEVVTMRVSFTPVNEIPPNGHIEVVFPDGIDLSMLPTTPQVGVLNGTEVFENLNASYGNVVVRVTGQAVQIVRDNSGDTILANVPFALLLTKIRNAPFPGLGGTYSIRTKAHDSLMDRNESVAATLFTTHNFKNVTLELSTDVAGGLGPVRLSFVPMNPIPADGRIHIKLPDEYVLLHPLHADWLEGADGFITTTIEPDGSILLSRDGEHEAPRYMRMVVEFSTIINVPRSGDSLTFDMCTQLHDRRRIDCVAPECTGCEADLTTVIPRVMQPAPLVNASVVPEIAVTGSEGLLVHFTTVNALRSRSILQIAIPIAFRVGSIYLEGLSFEHAECYERNNPPNNTASPVPLSMPPFTPANMDVSVNRSMPDHHLVSITMPALVRATSVSINVRGVRNPLWRGESGTFQLTIRDPEMVVVDTDLNISSVYIRQGELVAASVSVDHSVAGDMIALSIKFTSLNNQVPPWGYVEITLPPSFYACPCNLIDIGGVVSCAQVGCQPGNEIRPDFVEIFRDGGSRLNQGNLTYTAVDSNGTFIRLRPQESMSGEIELELRNIRSQNFSGLSGILQIQTRTASGELMDENLAVPGYTLLTAGKGYITNTKVTVMDPTAGRRGRLLVEFVPYNPLPPEAMIAMVLPRGFQVSANSSVAQPLGNIPSDSDYYVQEWDNAVSLDGELAVRVHSDVLVTVSRRSSTVPTQPHTRVAFFVDMVRNPPRSGVTGTFQVRTLLSSGVPIDEDLEVEGVFITPGNFTGACPPFCSPPEVKPTSFLAGSKVNISVAFYASNPLPSDGQIEVQLHTDCVIVGPVLVSAGSLLDNERETVEQVGPLLDGNLVVFIHGKTVRVRRDGTGRPIKAGEMVSLTIEGIQNQDAEGSTGLAYLWTKQSDGIVIDESVIPGHVLVPVEFTDFILSKDDLTAGKMSTLSISLSTSGPIKPGSQLSVDFSQEGLVSSAFQPLVAGDLVLDAASSEWGLSIEDGVRLVLLYQGALPIAGGIQTQISVSNVPNPAVASSVVYLMTLLAPGSVDSTDVYRTFQYEVGGLWDVTMTPESLKAGHTGMFTVSLRLLNPVPIDGIIEIQLPHTFAFTDTVTALVTADSWMDGFVHTTRTSETSVSLQRSLGSAVQSGGLVELVLYNVRNQEFSGVTPRMTVTTRTADGLLVDIGTSSPIVLSVASLDATSVTFDTGVAASVEKATVQFKTGSPIPHDGQLLVQFPAGTQILNPPEYMSFMGLPVKVTVYAGTPGPTDARFYSAAQVSAPYFSFNATHAQAPLAVEASVVRGPSVLLSRLGGASIPADFNVEFAMPGVKVRPWAGFSGTFQVMTMLSTFELIDQDRHVNGVILLPATLQDVAIEVSSLVSGIAVHVSINLTLTSSLPPMSEIHVTFPAGYRTIEYAKVVSHQGLVGLLEPVGVVPAIGGSTILKFRHTTSGVTPEGTKVFLVLTDIENRFFSSRSQYFQLDTFRADGVTHIERSHGIVVPTASDRSGAPGFGVVVENDLVMIFDSHDPSQAVGIVTLEEGTGSVTHGVSALDRGGDVVYFIAGGLLLALELSSPSLVTVPLKTGAQNMLGFVSMEWDVTHERLVGLALVDGEMAICTVDTVSGNVTRISDLPACGTCECSPSQGVSALDTARGIYYMASQVTVLAMNASTGALVSQTSVVQGEEGFLGFASLEFDGQGHHPRYIPIGLMGVALRGDMVELVHINPQTGAMKTLAKIFDEIFTGQIVGGISALTPAHSHYMLLAQSRLLAVDLETRVVSYYSPYSAGASGAWAFLEMSRFLKPLEDYVQAQTGGDNTNVVQRPTEVADLNITVVGLEESLPVKRGSMMSGNFFSARFSGADIDVGHRIQVSPADDCRTVLPGGGPFEVMSSGMHTQRFYLQLDDREPSYAQFCYSRPDGFDGAFRPLPYGGVPGDWLVEFSTTMAFFSLNQAPVPVGTSVSLTLSGALAAGDTFRVVLNDGSINVADLCLRAPLYPGTHAVAVVAIDPQQIRSYAFGAVTEIVADLLLEAAGGAALAVCYRPAASSSFALIRGRQRASAADSWQHKTSMAVAVGDTASGSQTCETSGPTASSSSSSLNAASAAYLSAML